MQASTAGMRCARTYFLANAATAAAAANGFTEAAIDGGGGSDNGCGANAAADAARDAEDVRVLVGLYAAAVSAGRVLLIVAHSSHRA